MLKQFVVTQVSCERSVKARAMEMLPLKPCGKLQERGGRPSSMEAEINMTTHRSSAIGHRPVGRQLSAVGHQPAASHCWPSEAVLLRRQVRSGFLGGPRFRFNEWKAISRCPFSGGWELSTTSFLGFAFLGAKLGNVSQGFPSLGGPGSGPRFRKLT